MAYGTRAGIEAIFGVANVRQWADRDNDSDESKITSAVTDALSRAQVRIQDRLREGPYDFDSLDDDEIPTQVVEITNMLAGCLLYEWRRITDMAADEASPNPTAHHKKHVDEVIRDIHGGRIRFAGLTKSFTDYPQAVTDDE